MKNSKKIITIVIACISIMMMIAGCSPRRTGNRIMNTGTGNNITNPQIVRTTSIRTIYVNTLSSLVKNGTITQAQADKVLAAVINYDNGLVSTNQGNSVTGAPTNTGMGTGTNINSGTGNSLNNGNGTGVGNETGIRTPMGIGTRMDNTIGNGSLTDNRTRTSNTIGVKPLTGRNLGIGNAKGKGTGVGMGSGTNPKTKTINRTGLGTSINDGLITSQSISGTRTIMKPVNISGLVNSGIITQSQANIINKKVAEAIKNIKNK